MKNYSTNKFESDPLQGNGVNPSGTNILGGIDDFLGALLFNDSEASSRIFGELTGYNSQQREFQQQEYLMEKEAMYNDPVYRMNRMKQAGINPNVAGSGIAGGTMGASAPAVSNNTQGVAGAVNALSGVANAITGGKASLAKAAFDRATINPTVDKLVAETGLLFENQGLTAAQRQASENYLKYMDEDQYTDLQLKRVNLKRMNQEFKNAKAQHDLILSTITKTDEEIELIRMQEGEAAANTAKLEAEKLRIEEETRYQNWINGWCEKNNIRPTSNTPDAIALDLWLSGGDVEGYFDTLADGYGKRVNAEQQAMENHAYAIENARKSGQNAADVLYGRVGSWADYLGQVSRDIGNNIQNIQDGIVAAFKTGGVNKQGREIRKELTMILDNAFEALDKYPEDAVHYQRVISDTQAALLLSNKELVEWYNKSKN